MRNKTKREREMMDKEGRKVIRREEERRKETKRNEDEADEGRRQMIRGEKERRAEAESRGRERDPRAKVSRHEYLLMAREGIVPPERPSEERPGRECEGAQITRAIPP